MGARLRIKLDFEGIGTSKAGVVAGCISGSLEAAQEVCNDHTLLCPRANGGNANDKRARVRRFGR